MVSVYVVNYERFSKHFLDGTLDKLWEELESENKGKEVNNDGKQ